MSPARSHFPAIFSSSLAAVLIFGVLAIALYALGIVVALALHCLLYMFGVVS